MEQSLKDPIISHFFQSVKKEDRPSVLRELILLGIHSVSQRIHGQNNNNGILSEQNVNKQNLSKENLQPNINPTSSSDGNDLISEILKIHKKIDDLTEIIGKNKNTQNKENKGFKGTNTDFKQSNEWQRWATGFGSGFVTDGHKNQGFRHHLDDSEIRKVLTNPYATEDSQQVQKGLDNSHLRQKQFDEQQLRKARTQMSLIPQRMENSELDEQFKHQSPLKKTKKSKNSKNHHNSTISGNYSTGNNFKNKTRSKIKSLIQKDKLKYQDKAFAKKAKNYCQFEYSDQQQFEAEQEQKSKSIEKSHQKQCLVHSRKQGDSSGSEEQDSSYIENQRLQRQQRQQRQFEEDRQRSEQKSEKRSGQKRSQKKSAQKYEKYEQRSKKSVSESDAVSESSTFSRFSMNSKRQVGKISGI